MVSGIMFYCIFNQQNHLYETCIINSWSWYISQLLLQFKRRNEKSPKDEIIEALVAGNVNDAPNEGEDEVAPPEDENEISSRYNYDEEFEVFKTSVLEGNITGVSEFAGSDEIDAEMIVEAFKDPSFAKLLEASTYDDLETDTSGEEVLLVLSLNVTGDTGNGEVYESGLYLYFSQGDHLTLENFFAAG